MIKEHIIIIMQADISRRVSALQAEAARLQERIGMSAEDRLRLQTERFAFTESHSSGALLCE